MLKKVFSYGFVEGISKGLNKLTLLMLPLFINTISYGKVGLLASIETLLPFFTFLGFDRAILRFYNKKETFNAFNRSINIPVNYLHIGLFATLSIAYLLGYRKVFGLALFPDVFLVLLLVYVQGKNLFLVNMLRVEENHKNYFKARLVLQLSKFVLVVGIVYFTKSYLGYLLGGIAAAVVTNFIYRIKEFKTSTDSTFSKETFKALFIFSWPFIFHGLASNLLGNADKFVLERFTTLSDVGLYTLSYNIGSAITFGFIGITVFMEPLIYKEEDLVKREKLLDTYLLYTLVFGSFLYLIITFLSIFVLPHIYGEQYQLVYSYIPLIALAHLMFPYYFKANFRMIYNKRSFTIASISVVSSVLNIVLNIIFIPKYGIFAAVVTTLISNALQTLFFVLISNNFNLNKEFITAFIFSTCLTTIALLQLHLLWVILYLSVFLGVIYLSTKKTTQNT